MIYENNTLRFHIYNILIDQHNIMSRISKNEI